MTGQCLCGAVRFELQGPLDFVGYCHCRSCRLGHGAPVVAWTSVPRSRRTLHSGADQLRRYASSPTVDWIFCGTCGSSLFYESGDAPDKVYVTAASLDDLATPPDHHVSYEERLPWFHCPDGLPRFRGKSDQRLED